MSWEVIGATVVVISVIYLAIQIRQNTATSRAEALRSFSFEISRQFEAWGTDEKSSGLFYRMFYEEARRTDFSPAEMMMLSFSLISRMSIYDAAYRSYKEGILTEEEFRPLLTTRMFDLPFTKDSWHIYKLELSPDFVSYLEKEMPQLLKDDRANET